MAAVRTLTSGTYVLDFDALYARLWAVADDLGDGSRLYTSEGETALKWLIAELAGTPAESGRTVPHNNALRRQVHAVLVDEGWAYRVNERKFRLLVTPTHLSERAVADAGDPELVDDPVPLDDPDDEGVTVDGVSSGSLADDTGHITVGGVEWSGWTTSV